MIDGGLLAFAGVAAVIVVVPQFVAPGPGAAARTVALAATFVLMGLAWLSAYALAVAAVGRTLARPGVRAWIERAAGAALVALGVRLALERRGLTVRARAK